MAATFGLLINANVKGENNIKRLGNSMQGVQGKVKNLKMAVGGLSTAFRALGAALAVGAIAGFAKQTIDQADAFGKLSTRTGIAANSLQAFVNAGKLADVSQQQLEVGLKTFARTSYEAAQGVSTYSNAYAALGVSVKNADGSLKASDDLLKEIADKFKDLPNGPEKAAIAMRLFGKSGADMITLLNGGSEALERFNYEVSDNFAQNAEYFNDQLTVFQIQFDGFRKQLMDALLPALNAIVEVFGDLFSSGQDFGPLFKVIEIGIRGVASVVLGLVQSMRFFVRTIRDLLAIAQLVVQRKFGAAVDVAKTGLADTRGQFFKDIEAQQKVLFGRSEVGADYGGGGRGAFTPGGDSKADKAAQARKAKANREAERAAQAAAREAEERRKAFGASVLQLEASEAALRIARESDPLKKIELQYEERRRVLLAENADAMLNAKSVEEALNIGRMTRNQLDQQAIEKQRELKTATEELDQSFGKIFKEGFEEYRKSLTDFGGQVSAAVTGAFQGMEDALVNFVMTGKANFRDFANAIIADIARIAVRQAIIAPLTGGIGSLFGFKNGGVFAQNGIVPFAKGGVVNRPTLFPMANGAGLMGEAGPEAVMPLRRGPGGRLGVEAAGGMGHIVVNVDATGSAAQGDDTRSKQLGEAIGVAVRHELIRQKRPGGLLS